MFFMHSKADVSPKPTQIIQDEVKKTHAMRFTVFSLRYDWLERVVMTANKLMRAKVFKSATEVYKII